MKILFHTQYYPPELGAPQSRVSELAQGLADLGYEVSVLTAMPNYPSGKLFAGYKKLFCKEELAGIRVYRSFIIPSQSASIFTRLLNYFSFVLSSLLRGLFLPKPDLIITESPPLFLGISGFFLSRLKGAKWIFNIADLWPRSALELGLIKEQSLFYKLSAWLESFCYRNAALVTGQSNTILADISARFPDVLTYHLSNGVDPSKFCPSPSTVVGLRSERECKVRVSLSSFPSPVTNPPSICVLYAGLHGLAQGLDQIIEAATRLRDQTDIEFVLIGDGPEKRSLITMAESQVLKNISFFDPVPKSDIPAILASADILIVPLKVQLTGAVPSKLYEAMAAAKPLILIAGDEAAEIVEDAECGIVVSPGDINALVNAIKALASDTLQRTRLGENGRKAVLEKYDRLKIVEEFAHFLQNNFPVNS